MRAFGRRWGLVMAILGLPVLGRGFATSNVLAKWGGASLIAFGLFFWLFFRHGQKMDMPDPNSG